MTFSDTELLERLGVALALGLLIGAERGWQARALAEGRRVAGIRTFGIIGLLGGLAAVLSALSGPLVLAAAFVGLAALLAVALWRLIRRDQDVGATTMIAALVTFALGATAGFGRIEVAAASAVVVTLLLGVKPELHGLLRRLEHRELMAVIHLLLLSVVLLPVLPDRGFGPWQALNPYRLWWMVVLVAALSSTGYFAIKLAGAKLGLGLTALLGGLVSSTAVTLNMARLGTTNRDSQPLLAAAVVVSAATMFPRILLVTAVVGPELLGHLVGPLGAATAVAFIAGIWSWQRRGAPDGSAPLQPRNPFELRVALQFGLLLGLIMVLARALRDWAGEGGLYLLAAVSGLSDVDAITLSYGSMTNAGEIDARVAALALCICAAVNTLVKPALVLVVCGARMALAVLLPLSLALLAGAAALWVPPL